ncbi:MAG: hypothetical protein EBZ59_00960 [Planctomycetia bacterium]|nr:hypothetical protein [Planctomycetia bacterium]
MRRAASRLRTRTGVVPGADGPFGLASRPRAAGSATAAGRSREFVPPGAALPALGRAFRLLVAVIVMRACTARGDGIGGEIAAGPTAGVW